MPETSCDGFFGERLKLLQPLRGHRAGHDAVLLAASVAARAGDVVVDLGAGVGTAGLGVALRVPGIDLVLIEIDPDLCNLASQNAANNRIAARVVTADVRDRLALGDAGIRDGSVDAVLMNPPFNDSRLQASPDSSRRRSHVAMEQTLRDWIAAAARILKSRGTLTLIWRADGLNDVLAALGSRFGAVAIEPVHPKPSKSAVRILVRATKDSRAPLRILPGLYVDGTDEAVQAAMIGKGTLPLADLEARKTFCGRVIAAPSRWNDPA